MNLPAPVRREVVVEAAPDRAFELFTGSIGVWWPLARFSVFEQDNAVVLEGGRIVERATDGRESVWGDVTEWDPPSALAFTWHPGYDAEHGTDVRVTFTASGDQTLVSLVHTGWERMDDPFARAAEYENGWPAVLAGFAALVASS
jgi:uncharacterized protein YndB with AHSA1/START domain